MKIQFPKRAGGEKERRRRRRRRREGGREESKQKDDQKNSLAKMSCGERHCKSWGPEERQWSSITSYSVLNFRQEQQGEMKEGGRRRRRRRRREILERSRRTEKQMRKDGEKETRPEGEDVISFITLEEKHLPPAADSFTENWIRGGVNVFLLKVKHTNVVKSQFVHTRGDDEKGTTPNLDSKVCGLWTRYLQNDWKEFCRILQNC